MERGEPSLFPEWYKGASSNNFNPYSGSSHSGEINSGSSSRKRLSISFGEHDGPRSLSFTERTSSSFHRSAISNGSMVREDLPLRDYGSFGRSHRDRNRDREKDLELCDKNQPLLEDNGFFNNADSLATNKLGKESLWHSHSMVSGSGDSRLKRPTHFSSNNVPSGGSIITGISKSSFESDFPFLGAEEKHAGSDIARVASSGFSTTIHNLPVTASAIIGGDGWTSALAEVPPIVGGNDAIVSSSLPASSTFSGLNMAETVAQAPAPVRPPSQLPSDSQKIEELHCLQILKLRPVMPSMPKNLGINSAAKSKMKGARTAEMSASKPGQQSPSQLIIHAVRPAVRSDVYKIFQPGNFQVLNREKNSFSPGVPPIPSGIPAATKGSMNPNLKVDGKGGALSPKKRPSQVQNRNDFFNSLRNKTSSGQQHSNNANNNNNNNIVSNSDGSSFISEKVGVQFAVDCSVENGNCSAGDCVHTFEEPEKIAPDEEEEAFLRSLGWEENAGVEALTHEEIESFLSEYKMRRPPS